MKRRQIKKRWGFTLVELLTTLAVIGILLGLLVPALNQVSKTATKVKQKAQFHAISTALEAFRNDYGDYPPSQWDMATYEIYSASQRLAEALVGRDGLGFHRASQFYEDGKNATGLSLYMNDPDFSLDYPLQADIDANLAARKGPYLELESANAVKYAMDGFGTKSILSMHSTEFGRDGNVFFDGFAEQVRDAEAEGCFHADQIIAVSGFLADELQRIYAVPHDKIHVVPNGSPLSA